MNFYSSLLLSIGKLKKFINEILGSFRYIYLFYNIIHSLVRAVLLGNFGKRALLVYTYNFLKHAKTA